MAKKKITSRKKTSTAAKSAKTHSRSTKGARAAKAKSPPKKTPAGSAAPVAPARPAVRAKKTSTKVSSTDKTSVKDGAARKTSLKKASIPKAVRTSPPKAAGPSPTAVVAEPAGARANDTGQLESLIRRMNDAVQGLQDLLEIPRRSNASLTRTTSLDRATATFQRLAAEVLDDQLGEILSPLIGLRAELSQYDDASGGVPEDFLPRWREILDHVLALAHLEAYEARVGERYDPLIHLAVGQTQREDLPEGVVAESCQPGYRSQRGRVLAPARVQINRR